MPEIVEDTRIGSVMFAGRGKVVWSDALLGFRYLWARFTVANIVNLHDPNIRDHCASVLERLEQYVTKVVIHTRDLFIAQRIESSTGTRYPCLLSYVYAATRS